MIFGTHTERLDALHTEMFSCVQEPPLIASPPEVDWCGRLLGHTREETTICIKGVPKDFVADQPEHTDNAGALRQPDDSSSVDPQEPSSTAQHPPVVADTPCASQATDVHTETAKCQRAVTNLFECPHFVNSSLYCSVTYPLPLEDNALDQWRSDMNQLANPSLAEETIKYIQAETQKLSNRNAKAALVSSKICTCKRVDPDTKKYIKCTVFVGVTETNIPRRDRSGCHVF